MNDALVQSIFTERKLKTSSAQEKHIENLRQPMRKIWSAYRNDAVKIDYSEQSTQEAYLLRYFLPYAYTLKSVLEQSQWQPNQDNALLEVCLLGCGPAPELLGIMCHLQQQPQAPQMLLAHFVDIAADTWRYGQRIAQRAFLADQWDTALLDTTSTKVDLCSTDLLANKKLSEKIANSQLIVVQNCLNETKDITILDNLLGIMSMMRTDAHLLIVDRAGYYPKTKQCFQFIDLAASYNHYHKKGSDSVFYTMQINNTCSSKIRNKLLYANTPTTLENDGLILGNKVKHNWRLIRKSAQGIK